MDLTRRFPRSPYDMNAGVVMLARTTDKARAHLAGNLGDYAYGCPLDEKLFEFFGLDATALLKAVGQMRTDAEIAGWVDTRYPRSVEEKTAFNNGLRHLVPDNDEAREWLRQQQQRLGRSDYVGYFDHLDADENRF